MATALLGSCGMSTVVQHACAGQPAARSGARLSQQQSLVSGRRTWDISISSEVGKLNRPCSRQLGRRGGRRQRGDTVVTCSLKDTAIGLGIFFTPSVLATVYAYFKGKGNLSDGFSRMLTEVTVLGSRRHHLFDASACCRVMRWGSSRTSDMHLHPSKAAVEESPRIVVVTECIRARSGKLAPTCQSMSDVSHVSRARPPWQTTCSSRFDRPSHPLALSQKLLAGQVSQGYFQPNVGGENVPTATGELSDLAGDEPLFKALYKW